MRGKPPHRPARLELVRPGGAAAPPPIDEIVLSGRRYRLVPFDGEPAPAHGPAAPVAGETAASLLTQRELQIASLVADGFVNKQIASALQISEWTVSTHLRRIFAKLGVDTRAAMVVRCIAQLGGHEPGSRDA